tara:strand:- start:139 stop:282 length:144 start_codon:yes stop_codon:yes gene_type:complete
MAKTPEEKKEICYSCKYYRENIRQCALCKCFIDLKVLTPSHCPIDKW